MARLMCACSAEREHTWQRRDWWQDRAELIATSGTSCAISRWSLRSQTDERTFWVPRPWHESCRLGGQIGWLRTSSEDAGDGLTKGQRKQLRRHLRERFPAPVLRGTALPAPVTGPGVWVGATVADGWNRSDRFVSGLTSVPFGPHLLWLVGDHDPGPWGRSRWALFADGDDASAGPALLDVFDRLGPAGMDMLCDLREEQTLREALRTLGDALAAPPGR